MWKMQKYKCNLLILWLYDWFDRRRTYCAMAPALWNIILPEIRSALTLLALWKDQKTWLCCVLWASRNLQNCWMTREIECPIPQIMVSLFMASNYFCCYVFGYFVALFCVFDFICCSESCMVCEMCGSRSLPDK